MPGISTTLSEHLENKITVLIISPIGDVVAIDCISICYGYLLCDYVPEIALQGFALKRLKQRN